MNQMAEFRKVYTPLWTLIACAAVACIAAQRTPAAEPAESAHPDVETAEASKDWKLVWSDEFDKDGRPDKWAYENGFVRNEELQWY